MGLLQRQELDSLLNTIQSEYQQVYLFFGERYLCRESADKLQQKLIQHHSGTVYPIDGDQEDHAKTLSQLSSFSLLPGLQIFRVTDSTIFVSKSVAPDLWQKAKQAYDAGKENKAIRHLKQLVSMAAVDTAEGINSMSSAEWKEAFGFPKPSEDLSWADKLIKAGANISSKNKAASASQKLLELFDRGFPQTNILILCVETVDKRQKLFTRIKKDGLAVDCCVDSGSSSNAQKAQKEVLRELVQETLGKFNKQIDPRALDMLHDRVGFHPVGLVMEVEKLVFFVGDRAKISCEDVEHIVGRSREDALFELTDAFGKNQVERAIAILLRLLDSGVHALAILATMRNYVRKLLIFRSLQHQRYPQWINGMQANTFQNSYFPAIKEKEIFNEMLKGHPYALYMSFTTAAGYSTEILKSYLTLLLKAEFRLKGSSFDQKLILQELFLSMFAMKREKKRH